ncbi:MAG TPA: T9SS type A sorting domain-containing protein, partial [Prolixibacteraceae bacterium]|nr:T9SS type A sorting domain-containing protein [Prolixibacteraceae bacterium]
PEQKEFTMIPDTKPFDIYTDFIGQSVYGYGNSSVGIVDFYSTEQPQAGKYALYWTGVAQYTGPGFDFAPNKDMSKLVANNYELDFWIKGDSPTTRFEIRFLDTKSEVAGDHPWRIAYTIDATKVKWDGTWQHIKIPLKSFKETGSWDGAWYTATGKYDWTAVDRLEFISEFGAMGTQKVWLDDIKINGTPLSSNEELLSKGHFSVVVYPNPMNETTTIQYNLSEAAQVNVDIYNLAGSKVTSLVNERQGVGRQKVSWDKGQSGVNGGIYICRITAGGKSSAIKIAVNN